MPPTPRRPPGLVFALATVAALAACRGGGERPPEAIPAAPTADVSAGPPVVPSALDSTPNAFLARGTPTFIAGTGGDERADRAVRAQIGMIAPLFPGAVVLDDRAVVAALERGDPWPDHPIVYGGPHVNLALAAIAPELPFTLGADRLAIGGEVFEGPGVRLIAVVPAGPSHPELLVYAGSGTPGVAEINGVKHGTEPILVADAFGRLVAGRWVRGPDGALAAALGPRARRIAWRTVPRELAGRAATGPVRFHFPAVLPAAADEGDVVEAAMRGLATVVAKLELAAPAPLDVYVYPDRRSKASLTGDGGDGHAVPAARALHVLQGDATPAARAAFEGLMAHEGTHLLAYEAWGPAGTSLLGEGLAVWVSGRYAGRPLAEWRQRLPAHPPVAALLGPGFRAAPEATAYPVAGLLVEAAVARVGLAGVRDHLLGADADGWEDACVRAGATATELEATLPR